MTVLKKNSGLTELTIVADDDEITIRDVSDTTNQATGETKRATVKNFLLGNALTKVSSTAVAFNAVAATTLYTVPTGKLFIPTMANIRAGGDAGITDVTFGRVGALTDWLGTIQLDNLDASGDQVSVMPVPNTTPVKQKTYAATVVFQIDVTVASGTATNNVDLFGYIIDV